MTELELLQHAKDYLDQLARGVDPLTGREAPESDLINNVRISRCLFYVSDVLRQVIDNGGLATRPVKKQPKEPFALSFEARSRFAFEDRPIGVSVIAQRLNALVDLERMQRLKVGSITRYLLEAGFLLEEEDSLGRRRKRPTDAGRELGVGAEQRTGPRGDYTAVVYDRAAQGFILDNLDAIIDLNNAPRYENQGKPWADEEDAYLDRAAQDGATIADMVRALKRSPLDVRKRLLHMNLIDAL